MAICDLCGIQLGRSRFIFFKDATELYDILQTPPKHTRTSPGSTTSTIVEIPEIQVRGSWCFMGLPSRPRKWHHWPLCSPSDILKNGQVRGNLGRQAHHGCWQHPRPSRVCMGSMAGTSEVTSHQMHLKGICGLEAEATMRLQRICLFSISRKVGLCRRERIRRLWSPDGPKILDVECRLSFETDTLVHCFSSLVWKARSTNKNTSESVISDMSRSASVSSLLTERLIMIAREMWDSSFSNYLDFLM